MQHAIDDLIADFDKKVDGQDLVEIDAPELPSLGGKIYCPQFGTPHRKNHCTNAREKEGLMAFAAEVLINFALDAQGKHLFKKGHKDALMKKVDDKVLERLSQEICANLWGDEESEYEGEHAQKIAKKPSAETSTS